MSTAAPVIQARDIGKIWHDGARTIDIAIEELQMNAGEFRVITGPSGAGKSTAMDLLALALRPEDRGSLHIDAGQGLRDMREVAETQNQTDLAKIRAAVFGYVVQTSELIPFLTVAQNFAVQQKISGRGGAASISGLARRLRIEELLNAFPADLSVGQRQRAAVVRALCCAPRVVLADEPTASQDPELKDLVVDVLKSAAADGAAVIMVTHDVALVQKHGLTALQVHSEKSADGGWYTRFRDESRAPC